MNRVHSDAEGEAVEDFFGSSADADTHRAPDEPVVANGPALWAAILATMPQGSVVAGGAVRDYLLGVEPKDIDVFCPTQALCEGWDWTGWRPLGSDRSKEYEAMSIIDVVQRTSRHGHQIDLVGVSLPEWSPLALVKTFDFGITRSWFDGADLHDTAEAGYDRASNVVSLLIGGRPDRAAERFARFNTVHGGRFTLNTEATAASSVGRSAATAPNPTGESAQ